MVVTEEITLGSPPYCLRLSTEQPVEFVESALSRDVTLVLFPRGTLRQHPSERSTCQQFGREPRYFFFSRVRYLTVIAAMDRYYDLITNACKSKTLQPA